jgi:hypothetical protein
MSVPFPFQNNLPIPDYTRQVLSGLIIPLPQRERFCEMFCDHLNGRSEREIQEAVEIIFETRLSSNTIAAFNANRLLSKMIKVGKGQDVAGCAVRKHLSERGEAGSRDKDLAALFERYKGMPLPK